MRAANIKWGFITSTHWPPSLLRQLRSLIAIDLGAIIWIKDFLLNLASAGRFILQVALAY